MSTGKTWRCVWGASERSTAVVTQSTICAKHSWAAVTHSNGRLIHDNAQNQNWNSFLPAFAATHRHTPRRRLVSCCGVSSLSSPPLRFKMKQTRLALPLFCSLFLLLNCDWLWRTVRNIPYGQGNLAKRISHWPNGSHAWLGTRESGIRNPSGVCVHT